MHDVLRKLQDDAWDMKDTCDDLAPRKLSQGDVYAIESVRRDMARLQAKLIGIRDKRKRGNGGDDAGEDDVETGSDFSELFKVAPGDGR